jgi:proteasome lid subunit RPN8/RPN11
VLEDDVAVEYIPGRNASPSPYHFQLEIDPLVWADLNDRDGAQAVFHSHVSSPPRPSRTDVENIGLWAGQPYLIYTLRTDELAAWRIVDGAIEPLPLTA